MKQMQTLRILMRYLLRHGFLLFGSLVCALVTVISSLYLPVLTGDAVDCIAGKGGVDFAALGQVLISMGITIAVTVVSQWAMNLSNNRLTYGVVRSIREDAIAKIETLPLSYLDTKQPGELLNRVIGDADQIGDGLQMALTQLFTGVMTIIGTIVFMLTLNSAMTLVVILITPLSLFVAALISSKTYHMFILQSQTRGEQTGFCSERFHNQKLIKSFHAEARETEQFDEINERLAKCSLKALFYSSLPNPSTRFVNGLVYTGVGVTGALSAISGRISVGQLVSFLSYANQYTKPFNEVTGVIGDMQNALACAGRLFSLCAEPSETEAEHPKKPDNQRGEVTFSDVSFSYVPDKKLIEHFSLSVKPGEKIAIVGPTGCGKTTLINLLMRFYDPQSGIIKLDGCDTKEMERVELRRVFGMVLQETWLMHGTVRDNIRYGRPDATDEDVIAAAKNAYAHGFITRLGNGYDTVIGDGGRALSAGQRQLLCIARIMLSDPSVLILDEATSSIDTRTEQKIQRAFDKLTSGRTSFIVAHRLSTIRNADKILVMKDGHILETGTHTELMARRGFYEQIYNSQFIGSGIPAENRI